MNNPDDCPENTNNDQPEAADLALVDTLLAELDLSTPGPIARTGLSSLESTLSAADAWQESKRRARQEARNKEERDSYAAQKEDEGRGQVRAYHWHQHDPRAWNETEAMASVRKKRNRQRIYRGTTNEDVEAREIMRQIMTPEQKKEAKRQRERDRRANMTPEQKRAEADRKQRKRDEARERAQREADASIEARRFF